jgi:predicted enzyme related to lactoylglutathione lyase
MAGNRVVHFEIPAGDPQKLAEFYTTLLGWKIAKVPVEGFDYWICRTGDGPGIDGAITRRSPSRQSVINSVRVEEIDAFLNNAVAEGARIIVNKAAVRAMGWYAVVADPDGNPLGFWQDDAQAQ